MSPEVLVELGDVIDVLRGYADHAFDACLCDPPYGLAFMGKRWDYEVPSVSLWAEVLRVLKPGAPLIAFFGTRTYHRGVVRIEDAGFEIRDQIAWMYGQGFPKSLNGAHGGTALKPAFEPGVLARKALDGTVSENFAKWGTGGLAIDASRVATDWSERPESWKRSGISTTPGDTSMFGTGGTGIECHPAGRWPANVLLDEDAAEALDEQSGILHTNGGRVTREMAAIGLNGRGSGSERDLVASSGGASRFFYCAKASKKDRGEGNTHPTVKPTALTEYLARLIMPPRPGALLVPFAGSGSEMIGAVRAGWPAVVGIEREAEYVEIARRRLGL